MRRRKVRPRYSTTRMERRPQPPLNPRSGAALPQHDRTRCCAMGKRLSGHHRRAAYLHHGTVLVDQLRRRAQRESTWAIRGTRLGKLTPGQAPSLPRSLGGVPASAVPPCANVQSFCSRRCSVGALFSLSVGRAAIAPTGVWERSPLPSAPRRMESGEALKAPSTQCVFGNRPTRAKPVVTRQIAFTSASSRVTQTLGPARAANAVASPATVAFSAFLMAAPLKHSAWIRSWLLTRALLQRTFRRRLVDRHLPPTRVGAADCRRVCRIALEWCLSTTAPFGGCPRLPEIRSAKSTEVRVALDKSSRYADTRATF